MGTAALRAVLRGVFKQPAIDIEKTLKFLTAEEIESALREAEIDKRRETRLIKRRDRHNDNFVWTPEKKEKLRQFNERMLPLYREAYDEVCRIKREFDERLANGDKNYEHYDIEVEFEYECEHDLPEKERELWDDLCELTITWGANLFTGAGRKMESFEEEMLIDDHSWNQYPFNTPELDDICIPFFMHDLFNHNDTFTLKDLMKMKPENFSWSVKISLDHWGKSRIDWRQK